MRKHKASKLSIIISLCAVLMVLVGFGWQKLNQRHTLPFPVAADPVISRRIFSMPDANEPPESALRMHDWKVIGDPVAVPPAMATELRDILSSPSTYTLRDSQCFEPGMAISFGDGATRVDVLICLLCNRAVFYRADSSQGRCISEEGNARLSSIYQRLFKTALPQ